MAQKTRFATSLYAAGTCRCAAPRSLVVADQRTQRLARCDGTLSVSKHRLITDCRHQRHRSPAPLDDEPLATFLRGLMMSCGLP